MFQTQRKRFYFVFLMALAMVFTQTGCVDTEKEKIGILFVGGGIAEDYNLDWRVQFYDHLFPAWPYGFLAGGPKEGGTCYTSIHYANEAESFICGVDEGTPIDALCNEYTGSYEVHSMADHWQGLPDEENTFITDCFPYTIPAGIVMTFSNSTIDPETLETIDGPHIDDPDGPGIGIADFVENSCFANMETLYNLPDNKDPSTRQNLKWFYGNDAPDFLGYEPEATELTNIKDALEKAMPEYEFVFRHGSEAFMKNLDIYGNPTSPIDGSTETSIDELINDEKVDRIVVMGGGTGRSNLTRFGPCWQDENGKGISALEDKTFMECIQDLDDGKGPKTQENMELYLEHKPVEELLKTLVPEVTHLVEEADPSMKLSFAPSVEEREEYAKAYIASLNHAVEKYSIPKTASLKIIFGTHGLSADWLNAMECDSYLRFEEDIVNRITTRIESDFSWEGKFEVTGTPDEFAEAKDDRESAEKPAGNIISTGEEIDRSINGKCVNAMGEIVDNGDDNFDYVIVILISWVSDSTDTLEKGRNALGNYVLDSIDGQPAYVRALVDADGTSFDAADYDSEYFTAKVYDGTGWPTVPGCLEDLDCETNNAPVYKGSTTNPTTVIISGIILSLGNGDARTNLTEAAVQSIIEAIQNPDVGGHMASSCGEH